MPELDLNAAQSQDLPLVPEKFQANQDKLSNVKKQVIVEKLIQEITNGSMEKANMAAAQLLISGGFLHYLDAVLKIVSEHLMLILTPSLSKWLVVEMHLLKKLKTQYGKHVINGQEFRNHIAQMTTLLCLLPKNLIIIPTKSHQIIQDTASRTIAQEYVLIAKTTGQSDKLMIALENLIFYHSKQEPKYCLFWINEIVTMQGDVEITPITTFKSPKNIKKSPTWILWNFIYVRIKPSLKPYLDDVVHLFAQAYSRNKLHEATCLIFCGFLSLKYQDELRFNTPLPLRSKEIIRSCAGVNYFY